MSQSLVTQLMQLVVVLVALYTAWSVGGVLRIVEERMKNLESQNAHLFRLVHLTMGAVAVRDVIRCGAGKLAVKLIEDYGEESGMAHEIEDLRRQFSQDDSPTPTGVN